MVVKRISKQVFSILLAITLVLSASVSIFAASGTSEVAFDVETGKTAYLWGETIDFTVTVHNSGTEAIDYLTVGITPEFPGFFSIRNSDRTVTNLPVGESKEVRISFTAHCNYLLRALMPVIKLFGIGKTRGYRPDDYDLISSVEVGAVEFAFGFSLGLGYENTETGKEIENLKRLNGDELPDTYMDVADGIPSFIDGAFSADTILDETDALHSLESIQKLMGINSLEDELQFYQKDTYDNNTFYRFQQYYNGIEVYGKNVIVVADENRKSSAMSNDYKPGISVNITPTIDEEKALTAAKSYIGSCNDPSIVGLRIYATDMDPTLVYMVSCCGTYEDAPFSGYVFVDANLGFVVANENLLSFETVTATSNGHTFQVWKNSSGSYDLEDRERNIKVYDAQRATTAVYSDSETHNFSHIVPEHPISSSSKNEWDAEAAIMMSNLSGIYDYYYDHYSRKSFDGSNGQIMAVINDGALGNGIAGNNGGSWSNSSWDTTVIAMGFVTGCLRYDVLAHEFLHSTERYIADMKGGDNETGGLKEAYADIMGEVLEASVLNGHIDWMHGTSRNIADPSQTNNPSSVSSNYRSTECHYISTIVSHAAYLMQQDQISDADRLGELWYRSMYYLDGNSTFEDCRAAVIAAARDMNMSRSEITCIQSCFDEVGIKGSYLSIYGASTLSGRVLDSATARPIAGAQIACLKTAPNEWGAGVVETDADGYFIITGLSAGTYEMSVSAPGYRPEFKYDVKIDGFSDVTLSSSILLDASLIEEGAIGGTITDAINGNTVSNATIKFRTNHGVKSGTYVSDNGSEITVETDVNGHYSYVGLKTGYYTMEVSKDGYITGYFDILSAPSNEICQNQDFSISPELPEGQYRIVLTWGLDPCDLDSHMTGVTSRGSSFHVYYCDKDAWDGDVHVVNLDVDDTTSFGPETVTLIPTTSDPYRYYIHRYAGSGSIATSGAHIEVYKGNSLIAVYDAPTNQGYSDYWTVFEIKNGTIITINKIGDRVYES